MTNKIEISVQSILVGETFLVENMQAVISDQAKKGWTLRSHSIQDREFKKQKVVMVFARKVRG